jgi:DNA replication and repair protein RecF
MLLDTYDEELARTGARVVMRRRGLVAALTPLFRDHFRALHSELPVSLAYNSDADVARADDEAGVRAALHAGLTVRRGLDERRRFTGFGPQTDDVDVSLDGRLAREHASQGQLRSLVLALKLAELTNVGAVMGEMPVLLLDDVPSELDSKRRGFLFEMVAGLFCQTLISVTERQLVPSLSERADYQVVGGRLIASRGG